MLRLSNLSLAWEPGKPVLSNIHFSFEVPGVYALMGSSGLGKTTLLKAMAGLLKPTEGSIEGLGDAKRAILFQENRLLPWLSVAKNVAIVMEREDEAAARRLLEALEIEEYESLPGTFSGGMQRRAALARALAYGAPWLLLDEPFTGMDKLLKEKVAQHILAAAPFVLFSTHDVEESRLMGAQTLLLHFDRLEKI